MPVGSSARLGAIASRSMMVDAISRAVSSPARAASLAGTAPALVLTCGHDPLCEEARAYAHRLERDGVPVTALHLSDQTHGILTMSRLVRTSATILSFVAEALLERWSLEGGRGAR